MSQESIELLMASLDSRPLPDPNGFFFWGQVNDSMVRGSFGIHHSATKGTVMFKRYPLGTTSLHQWSKSFHEKWYHQWQQGGLGPVFHRVENLGDSFTATTGKGIGELDDQGLEIELSTTATGKGSMHAFLQHIESNKKVTSRLGQPPGASNVIYYEKVIRAQDPPTTPSSAGAPTPASTAESPGSTTEWEDSASEQGYLYIKDLGTQAAATPSIEGYLGFEFLNLEDL